MDFQKSSLLFRAKKAWAGLDLFKLSKNNFQNQNFFDDIRILFKQLIKNNEAVFLEFYLDLNYIAKEVNFNLDAFSNFLENIETTLKDFLNAYDLVFVFSNDLDSDLALFIKTAIKHRVIVKKLFCLNQVSVKDSELVEDVINFISLTPSKFNLKINTDYLLTNHYDMTMFQSIIITDSFLNANFDSLIELSNRFSTRLVINFKIRDTSLLDRKILVKLFNLHVRFCLSSFDPEINGYLNEQYIYAINNYYLTNEVLRQVLYNTYFSILTSKIKFKHVVK